jgi:RHS repeat-associated protein
MTTPASRDYMVARYYSAGLGRFMSPDLLQVNSPDTPEGAMTFALPQLWNKYAYARNNPISYRDPDGRFSPPEHEQQTRQVLQAAGFGEEAIAIVVEANRAQDSWASLLPGFDRNHEHAMRNEGQCVGDAMSDHAAFVEERLDTAADEAVKGNFENSLTALGQGLHAVQDEKHGFISMEEHGTVSPFGFGPSAHTRSDWRPSARLRSASLGRTTSAMDRFRSKFIRAARKAGMTGKQIRAQWKALQQSGKKKKK